MNAINIFLVLYKSCTPLPLANITASAEGRSNILAVMGIRKPDMDI